ncbi:hypothetical protein KY363_00265 [Candidatus Woesearchaeota archaeon]|nr:hypothetical protein [Candidatus Woesearchaeota archaeon]
MAKRAGKDIRNRVVRYVLSAVAVAFFGFILLNLAFILDALYQNSVRWLVGRFILLGPELTPRWFPVTMHASFVVIIGIISWLVFRSKLGEIYKAVFMTVPVATVLVTTGMFLSHWPVLSYSVGALLCAAALYIFYRTRQPWIYYYTVILVGVTLAVFTLLGGEI